MQHSHHENTEGSNGGGWLFSRTGIATCVALAVLGFLIYEGHGAHLLGYLPYLLILACPLMHIFMHGGHGGHGGHGSHRDAEEEAPRRPESQQQAANAPQAADTQKSSQEKQHQHKNGGCH